MLRQVVRHSLGTRRIAAISATLSGAATCFAQPNPEQLAWVKAQAIPFATVEAGHGFDDLQPLKTIIGEARVVGLGEATHGTREHFQMKHRLVGFLVEEMGFTTFGIEASTPEAYRLDRYVLTGEGDPARLIGGMLFWTWNTEEVLDMVQWMREYNVKQEQTGSPKRVRFTGNDMQTPDFAARILERFLAKADPEAGPGFLTTIDRIVKMGPGSAAGFGVATAACPVEIARGKKLKFSASIKTQDVEDGFAGLWWRCDGPDQAELAFDNMQNRGPRGTTEWATYAIELQIPPETANINFGFLMPGAGQAWFDQAVIELDGVATPIDGLDLTFDGDSVRGLFSPASEYSVAIDRETKIEGAGALTIRRLPEAAGPKGQEVLAEAKALLAHLEQSRPRYLQTGLPSVEVEWAIHMARILTQYTEMTANQASGFWIRDRSMAENAAWSLEHDPAAKPGDKIVLWAHNWHVCLMPEWMGYNLRQRFGDAYVAIGFAAGEGTYYAVPNKPVEKPMATPAERQQAFTHALTEPPPMSLDWAFRTLGMERAILDLRLAKAGDAASGWLRNPLMIRNIGALAMDTQFSLGVPTQMFDVMIFVNKTSAARQLTTGPGSIDDD